MVWCVKSSSVVDGSRFTGVVVDEHERLTVNCEYVLLTPGKYLEFVAIAGNSGAGSDEGGKGVFTDLPVQDLLVWLFFGLVFLFGFHSGRR
jgi:hypothetical protein